MTTEEILQNIYGFSELRPSQKAVIEAIETGRDVLALLPTGGGKSLCYQLPVLKAAGRALVVTPLISLMEDQVAELKRLRLKAVCIHSYLDIREKRLIYHQLQDYQFIFCSPEWLATDKARATVAQLNLTHMVIDEAHCISEWGYDFRPHYLLLHEIIKPSMQVIALTATADDKIIRDINQLLRRELLLIDKREERRNIFLSVCKSPDKLKEIESLLDTSGPTIIYFSSKKRCNEVHQLLSKRYKGMTYHADMTYEDRMSVQLAFLGDRIHYVCATSAFGMGVNKSNVRTVVHYHTPKSVLQYIQEVGRAGRDGEEAQAILLYDEEDLHLSYRLLQEEHLSESDFNLYLNGAQLTAEKMERLSILRANFSDREVLNVLRKEYHTKLAALRKMAEYGQLTACLSHQLYNGEQPCTHCEYCQGRRLFTFETFKEVHENDDMVAYIKSLFKQG
ncbi:RecQ family ATP-dependent DNA helicase [Macrococcus bovicus]|uniref:RecQ family ATP-dependent DNA helicase n=1 Tax=Macrococcus bovicus TaxID=69968 RepID=UPI0025A53555|nr:RecQ family ATP-dependent DNA helicase [Macrococcus bovicus]WJP96869.1 RecQ family ATP-dependent DNA helicase [Macrococcus bovicus]